MQDYFNHLSDANPVEIMERIRAFKKLPIANLSDRDLRDELYKTILINEKFQYIVNQGVYPAGTRFYRVRELSGCTVPFAELTDTSGFWYPPSSFVKKMGRMNKPGESVLYCTPTNPFTPIYEVEPKANSFYALIAYESLHDINVNIIGGEYDYQKLGIFDEKTIVINDLLNDFLRDEFSMVVGHGTEYLYRISEIIAKDFFDLPTEVQDAWAYPSICDKKLYNTCFRPEKADALFELKGALIAKHADDNMGNIYPACIAYIDEENNTSYIQHDPKLTATIIPEIPW